MRTIQPQSDTEPVDRRTFVAGGVGALVATATFIIGIALFIWLFTQVFDWGLRQAIKLVYMSCWRIRCFDINDYNFVFF